MAFSYETSALNVRPSCDAGRCEVRMVSKARMKSCTSSTPSRLWELAWPVIVTAALAMAAIRATWTRADDVMVSTRLSPSDYLLHSRDTYRDPVFDKYRVVDLSAKLGIGSDCGR